MAEAIALALVVVFVVGTIVGPLVWRALAPHVNGVPPKALPLLIAEPSLLLAAPPSPPPGLPAGEPLGPVSRIEGRIGASSSKRVREIVDQHPYEALDVIRRWMHGAE